MIARVPRGESVVANRWPSRTAGRAPARLLRAPRCRPDRSHAVLHRAHGCGREDLPRPLHAGGHRAFRTRSCASCGACGGTPAPIVRRGDGRVAIRRIPRSAAPVRRARSARHHALRTRTISSMRARSPIKAASSLPGRRCRAQRTESLAADQAVHVVERHHRTPWFQARGRRWGSPPPPRC